MKKVLTLFCGIITSVTGHANNWQQLNTHHEIEAPVMHEVQYQNKTTKTPTTTHEFLLSPREEYKNKSQFSVFTEYSQYKADLDGRDSAKLKGFSIGISTPPTQAGWYGKFEALSDSNLDADYYSLSIGGQKNLLNYKNFYLLGSIGLGYSWAESSLLNNDVNFISLPIGLELGYSVTSSWSVYGGIGYQWLWDTTSNDSYFGSNNGSGKTLCNDGTWSNSTGQGTCSHHDGVSQNPSSPSSNIKDTIGDNDGVTYRFGLRYNF